MPTLANSSIPAPKSWDEFEDIALSASKIRWKSEKFFRNGRQGQKQDGVDVWGTSSLDRRIGIQCKNTISGVSQSVVEDEIKNASAFCPALNELYIATTAPRDATLQKTVRAISEARVTASQFSVDILFWDDICGDLVRETNVFSKHYPQFALSQPRAITDDHIRLRMFINHIGPLIDYLRQMGGEVAHRINDTPFEQLSDISYHWPITNLLSWNRDVAKKQNELVELFREIYGMYNCADYHDHGSGIIFTWKSDQQHNASLDSKKRFAEMKIKEILSNLEYLQHVASTGA